MNKQELSALVQLLNRCPMSQPEALWLQALISREEAGLSFEAAQVQAHQLERVPEGWTSAAGEIAPLGRNGRAE